MCPLSSKEPRALEAELLEDLSGTDGALRNYSDLNPPGCRFHPRCPVLRLGETGPQEPRCLKEVTALEELASDHRAACHVAAAETLRSPKNTGETV